MAPSTIQVSWYLRTTSLAWREFVNLVPRACKFLWRMLDENEGSGKEQFLFDLDSLSEIQYNTISPLFADY